MVSPLYGVRLNYLPGYLVRLRRNHGSELNLLRLSGVIKSELVGVGPHIDGLHAPGVSHGRRI